MLVFDFFLDALVHAIDRLLIDPAALFQDVLIDEDRVVPDRRFRVLPCGDTCPGR